MDNYIVLLTDSHLNDCMRMAVTNYIPEISKLAERMQIRKFSLSLSLSVLQVGTRNQKFDYEMNGT